MPPHIYTYILFYIDVVRVVDSTVVKYRSGALHRFVGHFLVSRPSNQLLSWEVGGGPPGRPSTFDFWGANLLLPLEKEYYYYYSRLQSLQAVLLLQQVMRIMALWHYCIIVQLFLVRSMCGPNSVGNGHYYGVNNAP